MKVLNTRAGLSTMWIFVMINMIYADILGFMDAAVLKQIMSGQAGDIRITPAFLLLAAVMTEVPIAMIIGARMLPHRANRWANIVAAAFTAVYVIGLGTPAPHYIFIAGLEVLGCALIAWGAWRLAESDLESAGSPLPAPGQPKAQTVA
jgi:uncharacterized membrane protein YhaH (DUF805 family)